MTGLKRHSREYIKLPDENFVFAVLTGDVEESLALTSDLV